MATYESFQTASLTGTTSSTGVGASMESPASQVLCALAGTCCGRTGAGADLLVPWLSALGVSLIFRGTPSR